MFSVLTGAIASDLYAVCMLVELRITKPTIATAPSDRVRTWLIIGGNLSDRRSRPFARGAQPRNQDQPGPSVVITHDVTRNIVP
jgi:hypothetical protein